MSITVCIFIQILKEQLLMLLNPTIGKGYGNASETRGSPGSMTRTGSGTGTAARSGRNSSTLCGRNRLRNIGSETVTGPIM